MLSKTFKYHPSRRRFIRQISLVLLFAVMMSGLGNSLFSNYAYAAKAGKSCTKVGLKSGSFVCTKVKSKLVWKLVKKKQTISISYPSKVDLASQTLSIDYSASSRLPVKAISASPAVCTLNGRTVSLVTVGYCAIRLNQAGNSRFFSAKPREIKILILGSNQISFSIPGSLPLSTKTYSLAGISSSGLPLTYESLTSDTCSVSETTLMLTKLGLCTVRASQSGSDFYVAAQNMESNISIQGSNQISVTPQISLLLSAKTYLLSGTSTSGFPLTYESLTTDICSVSEITVTLIKLGLCTVRASQSGSDFYEAAQPVEVSISISGTRVTSDQPDTVTGFQVKAIYVVPSDGVDNSYDTNGYIAGILDEGNKYLQAQLGLTVPTDKNTVGYDIQFLKSKLSTQYLQTASDLTEKLLSESMNLENPGMNRKDYIFFIDVNSGLQGTDLEGTGLVGAVCGYGRLPGISAVVAIGKRCTDKGNNFENSATYIWPHELIHNFGVNHTTDTSCDLMSAGTTPCTSGATLTIDKEHTRYVGSSAQGQDILKLRVWEGNTQRVDLQANCSLNPVPRADGFNYAYCPTGTQAIGALKYCWSSISSVTLEEFVDGTWKSLGAGSHYSDPWGPNVSWKCSNAGSTAPWKELTVTTPGVSLYRWMVNGSESEQFKVIWVR